MKTYEAIVNLFEQANRQFLLDEQSLLASKVSERTLCGALMLHIHDLIKVDSSFAGYHADVEYNRNKGNIKTVRKTIVGQVEQIVSINCDLILHSRGANAEQDNLMAIEMKKSDRSPREKNSDKARLMALTKDTFDDVWIHDGHHLPEHVCRYVLGVYYEINYRTNRISIEYYRQGEKVYEYTCKAI